MEFIGFDKESGEGHWVPPGEKDLHEADTMCGCNPDSGCDEGGWMEKPVKIKYWWYHHQLERPSDD